MSLNTNNNNKRDCEARSIAKTSKQRELKKLPGMKDITEHQLPRKPLRLLISFGVARQFISRSIYDFLKSAFKAHATEKEFVEP
jgi:hypothetical protein